MSRLEARAVSSGMIRKKKHTLADLFLIKIQSLYDIEYELIKALPKMASKASDQKLKAGFRGHLDETRAQVARLEQIFKDLGQKPKKNKVEAIRGMCKDTVWILKNITDTEALDVALIAATSHVEHYEMASYNTAINWAEDLGYVRAAKLLNDTLTEEIGANEKLMTLATEKIDRRILPMSEGE